MKILVFYKSVCKTINIKCNHTFFCNERKCVLREIFSFSLITQKITRPRHFREGKIGSTMVEESAIEKKYIFYIAVDPEHLCIFDREKAEKALKEERNERAYGKCRKYDWNEQIFRAFLSEYFSPSSLMFQFCTSFSERHFLRLKSVVYILDLARLFLNLVEYFNTYQLKIIKITY